MAAALELYQGGTMVTREMGPNAIKKMVPAFRRLTGIESLNRADIAKAFDAAVIDKGTWGYNSAKSGGHGGARAGGHGGAGFYPVVH
jgi:hypothetical protein